MRLKWKYRSKEAAAAIRAAIAAGDQKEARRIYNAYVSDDGAHDLHSRAASNRYTRMFKERIYMKGARVVAE